MKNANTIAGMDAILDLCSEKDSSALSLKKTMMNNCETCRHLVYFCGAHGCLMNRDVDFRLDRLCQDYDEAEW